MTHPPAPASESARPASASSLVTATESSPAPTSDLLNRLGELLAARREADPQVSYVARLMSKGPDSILKKIGEEATETVMAAKDGVPDRIVSETADLWFHTLVMLAFYNLRPQDVLDELARREGLSGLAEKAARTDSPTSLPQDTP
ncbi:MAG: phosphoribosyl-ATP diphosphatase [Burkholderiaceae bacterium]